MVKIKKSKKGEKYIIPEIPDSGFHISVHRSGHVHLRNGKDFHEDIKGDRKDYFLIPGLEKLLEKGDVILRSCEKYPDCVCLDLPLNPKLMENKKYGEVCLRMQEFFDGGPCPAFHGVWCIWSGFCEKGLDPSPLARKLPYFQS